MDLNQNEEDKGGSFVLEGGIPLSGEVRVQGSKNAALPLMAASLLVEGKTVLHNVPDISDTRLMRRLLKCLGAGVEKSGGLLIDAENIRSASLPEEAMRGMRSSVLLAGPLLARFGEVSICYPGGCMIGERPINLHLKAFEKLGARVEDSGSCIRIASDGLKGAAIEFPFPSVGATENALMAAMGAREESVIRNAAREPEVTSLCRFLCACGAHIEGIGTSRLLVRPGTLHGAQYTVPADRIVAGTYMMALAGTGGSGILHDVPQADTICVKQVLCSMGVGLSEQGSDLLVCAPQKLRPVPYIATDSYPGFPTDMQPMLAAVLSSAAGSSEIQEQVFEARFGYVDQLRKMGADITRKGDRIKILPCGGYRGCGVKAQDLRGGAALIVAGLMAKGTCEIGGACYIRRGYEDIVRDIRLLGGRISEKEKKAKKATIE